LSCSHIQGQPHHVTVDILDDGQDGLHSRDEATTFLLGGHETTAIALAWMWHLLAQHPDVEEWLAKHLEVELRGRPPRFEDLPRLTYLQQVLSESLRLYPPAWYMTRRADRDVEIGGYRVSKGRDRSDGHMGRAS
jgi:cytochrome P450